LSAEQRKRLDELTKRREDTGQNWLTWLRQMPQATKPAAMLGLIARLQHVRALDIDAGRGHLVHQARLVQIAREAARVTVQHVAGYERQRRHATLVAIGLDLHASLTDQAVDLFDGLVGSMFRRAKGRQARAFQADRPRHQRQGPPLCPGGRGGDRGAEGQAGRLRGDHGGHHVGTLLHQRRRSRGAGPAGGVRRYEKIGEHYAAARRWSPAFLDTFTFEGVPAAASLLRAIEVLREANRKGSARLSKSAPTSFIRGAGRATRCPAGRSTGATMNSASCRSCASGWPRARSGSAAACNTAPSKSG